VDDKRLAAPVALLAVLFFLSGATGLIYEVLWTRRLTLVFGHSMIAASTVLAAYMGGLGLGSLAGGRWADRAPERYLSRYALLEAGIGLAALLTLPLLSLVRQLHLLLARAGTGELPLTLASLGLSALVLFPPTLMMGATLPVLARGLARVLPEGRLVGLLYGLNTVGACLGAALAGYLLLPTIGLTASVLLSALANFGLAGLAAQASRRPVPLLEPAVSGQEPPPASPWAIPLAMAVAGAAAMIYEVGWTRGLVLSLGSSTYALATILALFLAGLGLGGLLYGLLPSVGPRTATLAGLQLATALWGALASYLLGLLPYLAWILSRSAGDFGGALVVQNVLAGLIVTGPALLLGLAFPLAVELYAGRGLGGRLAMLYSANTAGCVAGALLAGLWLLPSFGAQTTLKVASLSLLASALWLLLSEAGTLAQRLPVWVGCGLAGFLVLLLPAWNPALMTAGMAIYAKSYNPGLQGLTRLPPPMWVRDGESATISLHSVTDGGLSMRTNGKADASTSLLDLSTQYLLGYIPALYARPKNVAVIGLGSGMTLQALAAVPGVERLECAELEPAVTEAFRYWQGYNGHVGRDPRVHLRSADGRTFLETSREKYDLIVSEPSNVWVAGVGNLYTREFYAACLSRLNPAGVMAQWFQNYAVSAEEIGMVVNTFYDVFPQGALWVTSVRENDILLIGSRQPIPLDLAWVRQVTAVPQIRRHLLKLGLCDSEAILGHYLCSREAALSFFGRSRLNTDDRPALEFQAARRLFSPERAQLFGLSKLLSDPSQPLPEGLEPTPALLQAAVQGWMSSRGGSELVRLLKAHEPAFAKMPLVLALTASLDTTMTPAGLLAAFKPAVQADPTNLAAYLLGLQLESRGAWEQAIPWYARASRRPPAGAEAQVWLNLGSCLARVGQTSQSIEAYRRAVAEGGGYEALTLLGDACMRAAQPSEALRYYSQAAAENHLYTPALWGRGQAFVALGDYRQAAAAFREVVDLSANNVQALMNLAYCYLQLKEPGQARAAYQQVLRYAPNHAEALNALYQLDMAPPGALTK